MAYRYKLCITIPTYNRETYLKRLLNSIISQNSFSNEISVVINDWPSKDNTEKMVKEFQKQYKNIFYYRNEKAVWMLPAILESMDMSNWEYTWLFWSDDFLASDTLWNMLKCINEYHPKIIYSRRKEVKYWEEIVDKETKLEILPFKWMSEFSKYLWDKTRWTFHDKDVIFTFMSVFCVDSDYYKESYDNLINNIWYSEDELKKNYFNFNLITLTNIENESSIIVIDNPIFVYCDLNHWRNPNLKIANDLKYLVKSIIIKYRIRKLNSLKFFLKLCFSWYIWSGIVPFLKKYKNLYSFIKRIFFIFKS